MEKVLKILLILGLVVFLWKPIWRFVKAGVQNAKMRIISFAGGIITIIVISIFLLFIQWVSK